MNPILPQDVEQFVSTTPDGAVRIEGTTGATYWVLTDNAVQVRTLVLKGLAEAERGETKPWDSSEIKSAARRLKEQDPS